MFKIGDNVKLKCEPRATGEIIATVPTSSDSLHDNVTVLWDDPKWKKLVGTVLNPKLLELDE